MKNLLLIILLLKAVSSWSQQIDTTFFSFSGCKVEDASQAYRMVLKTQDEEKMLLKEYNYVDGKWELNPNCQTVKEKSSGIYLITYHGDGGLKYQTKLEVQDTLDFGYSIRETKKGEWVIGAYTKQLFPPIYHGDFAYYDYLSGVSNSFYIDNMKYESIYRLMYENATGTYDTLTYKKVKEWPKYPGGYWQLKKDMAKQFDNLPEGIGSALPERYSLVLEIDDKGYPSRFKVMNSSNGHSIPMPVEYFSFDRRWIPACDSIGPISYTLTVSLGKEVSVEAEEGNFIMPEYPGGEEGLRKYIATNVNYPVIAQENGIQGQVVVNFVVNDNGYVMQVSFLKRVDPYLDAEAKRVVENMKQWKPGYVDGIPVDVEMTVPINFVLQ
ncbi:MAG: energy transducer TonB [Carboxylicivirga sp.]|jgi:TonB family protein|nr:energy transducer TonB [Carboxylicivirga sp.]